MQCSRCKCENEDAAKFCATCGSPLFKAAAPICHICSHANAPGANFCVACGAHLRRHFAAAPARATAASMEGRGDAGGAPPPMPPRMERTEHGERAEQMAAAAASAAQPSDRPPPGAYAARPDLGGAAHRENFESAALRPPRISGFELKAGIAVLVLVVGGGLYWWSTQNDSRLAELALTAVAPASSALRAVVDKPEPPAPTPLPESPQDSTRLAAASETAPVAPTAAVPTPSAKSAPATPVAAPAPAPRKPVRHKTVRRRHVEPEVRTPAPVVPAEPEPRVVAQTEPTPTPAERRAASTRAQVASCRRMSLFDGERCLWRICDGRWGKDGCPSYN